MKRCPRCEETKGADEYYSYDNGSKLSSYCKECQRKRSLTRYHNRHTNPSYKNKRTRYPKRDRARLIARYSAYLRQSECMDCGENNPVVLVFHHRDPKEKTRTISNMISHKLSWKSVLAEITKCDCLCANCHVLRHHKLGEYRTYLSALSSEE